LFVFSGYLFDVVSIQKNTWLKAQKVMDMLLDPYLALSMTYLLSRLECINSLIKFAQGRNVFICDFVVALATCQRQLYKMYIDTEKAYGINQFVFLGKWWNVNMKKSM
jgi:hypothetical protein